MTAILRGIRRWLTDGGSVLVLLGAALVAAGAAALGLAAAGAFLPHDVAFLGMTREDLCAVHGCRVVHFMIHDRAAFGGAVVADGLLYLWLAAGPLRRGRRWAWRALLVSGAAGFLGFLAHAPTGYLDVWHAAATLTLLPLFILGLIRSYSGTSRDASPPPLDAGRICLLAVAVGLTVGGATILAVGASCVFVPQDLTYVGLSAKELDALNPRLIPLIAQDRIGFGGAVISCGLALWYCARQAETSPALCGALSAAAAVGFGPAVGVHLAIGYVDGIHLAPAVAGALLSAVGLLMKLRQMRRRGGPCRGIA